MRTESNGAICEAVVTFCSGVFMYALAGQLSMARRVESSIAWVSDGDFGTSSSRTNFGGAMRLPIAA